MQMKMFAFECGLLMGMAAVCLLPPVRNEMKTMFQKAKNSMQSTKKVLLAKGKKLKEDTLDAASDIRDDVQDLAESIMNETESSDRKGLTPSSKKALGKIKAHAVSLKSLTE